MSEIMKRREAARRAAWMGRDPREDRPNTGAAISRAMQVTITDEVKAELHRRWDGDFGGNVAEGVVRDVCAVLGFEVIE